MDVLDDLVRPVEAGRRRLAATITTVYALPQAPRVPGKLDDDVERPAASNPITLLELVPSS
jgi:hypothetical protein